MWLVNANIAAGTTEIRHCKQADPTALAQPSPAMEVALTASALEEFRCCSIACRLRFNSKPFSMSSIVGTLAGTLFWTTAGGEANTSSVSSFLSLSCKASTPPDAAGHGVAVRAGGAASDD